MGFLDRLKTFLTGEGTPLRTFGELDASTRHGPPGAVWRPLRRPELEAIDVTPEFRLVESLLGEKAPFILVLGQAGTGKTTLIHWLSQRITPNCAILAPTGLAAITAGGQTIHSFFKLPPAPPDESQIRRRRDKAIFEKLELLIIDEISMVPCDLLDLIDKILRYERSSHDCEPFGGVRIVAVGDLHQLPPVISDRLRQQQIDENYTSVHFFSAKVLSDILPASVELTKPFRQSDPEFLGLLRSLRELEDMDTAIERINSACLDPAFDRPEWPVAVPTRRKAFEINQRRMEILSGPARTYTGKLTGRFLPKKTRADGSPRLVDDSNLPSPIELTLKRGTRVVFTKNDKARRWVNGTMGTVTNLHAEHVTVRIEDNPPERNHEVRCELWEKTEFEYDREQDRLVPKTVGSYSQLPIMPAWAMTIHKLQGQTLSRLVVDLGSGTFAAGQTYVALSRCRTLEGLKLRKRLTKNEVRTDPQIRRFMEAVRPVLANRLLEESGYSESDHQEPA